MIVVDIQLGCEFDNLPTTKQFELWCTKALEMFKEEAELTILLCDKMQSQQLNNDYRGKDKPTNVLSFEFDAPPGVDISLIGDLVISPEIVKAEAIEQNKHFHDHFAHLVIHGCLHLIGFDHINDVDAEKMESLEKEILNKLNISDPYRDDV